MDILSNLLTSIRNAELANHTELTVPHSKISSAVLTILKENGYVATVKDRQDGNKKLIDVTLPQPLTLHHYKRVSKPGRRLYTEAKEIPTVLRGLGMVILSTPEGVLSGKEARKRNVGGEVICEVY